PPSREPTTRGLPGANGETRLGGLLSMLLADQEAPSASGDSFWGLFPVWFEVEALEFCVLKACRPHHALEALGTIDPPVGRIIPVGPLDEPGHRGEGGIEEKLTLNQEDRKSTRLNSSHVSISYAV